MYQVLARKWRPRKFSSVVGQEHIVRALANALTQQRLHHAYLFTGTRGVGKTSIARILAKCFNCQTGITSTPCDQCDVCLGVDDGSFIDLIEVDAASRTRVEDTRDLLDNVQYAPVSGRYKVYIIDEVHMLSGHSFNALLKTFEEPPGHVKFLLATTDPQKLPITILSRCLQFNLRKIYPSQIQQQLVKILVAEGIPYEESALARIATVADGSVRDALSLLDQAIAYGAGTIKSIDVSNMLGSIDRTYIFQLLESLATNDAGAILRIISELAAQAKDFSLVLDELLNCLHQVAITQLLVTMVVSASNYLLWAEDVAVLQKLARAFDAEAIQLYYQIGLISKRDLLLSPTMQGGFEMMMMRMLAFRPASLLPQSLPDQSCPNRSSTALIESSVARDSITMSPAAFPLIDASVISDVVSIARGTDIVDIYDMITKLKVSGPTAALLQHCSLAYVNEHEARLLLAHSQAPLLNKNHEARLQKALSDYLGRPMRVVIEVGDDQVEGFTPAAQQQQKKAEALRTLGQDVNIKKILSSFDAAIITESVTIES